MNVKIRNLWNRARAVLAFKDKKKEKLKKACRKANNPRDYL